MSIYFKYIVLLALLNLNKPSFFSQNGKIIAKLIIDNGLK